MAVQQFKRPLELRAFKGRLERALQQEKALAQTGEDFDRVQDEIDVAHEQIKGHVGYLKDYQGELAGVIKRMIGDGSNHPPQGADGPLTNGATPPKAEPDSAADHQSGTRADIVP